MCDTGVLKKVVQTGQWCKQSRVLLLTILIYSICLFGRFATAHPFNDVSAFYFPPSLLGHNSDPGSLNRRFSPSSRRIVTQLDNNSVMLYYTRLGL